MTKFLKIDDLQKIIKENKVLSKTIGLCHGTFDLMHIGHIKHFQEAKTLVDLLVVTITPDKYVNKGPDRPIFNENLRGQAIAALDAVDYVALNDWPTSVETIKFLKPNIYIKGQDYKNFELDISGNIQKEEDAVKLVGGSLYITNSEKFSSSFLINNYLTNLSLEQKECISSLKKKYSIKIIEEYLKRISNFNLLLVGETIIDEYVFCDTIGKSGKEPVLVNKKINSEKYPGGVLSVANAISSLIKSASILTSIGDQNNNLEFIKKSLTDRLDVDYIIKSSSSTILKTRFVDRYTKTKILGVYDLNDNPLKKEEVEIFNKKILKKIVDKDLVIEMDYNHGLIADSTQKQLIKNASFLAVNGQINSFNISFHNLNKYLGANYLCINESELRHHFRNKLAPIEELLIRLYEELRLEFLVVTSGSSGSLCYDINRKLYKCPAFASKIVDRVGAGDTFIAVSSLCFVTGIPTDLSLFISTLAASEAVLTMGTNIYLNKLNLLKAIEVKLK